MSPTSGRFMHYWNNIPTILVTMYVPCPFGQLMTNSIIIIIRPPWRVIQHSSILWSMEDYGGWHRDATPHLSSWAKKGPLLRVNYNSLETPQSEGRYFHSQVAIPGDDLMEERRPKRTGLHWLSGLGCWPKSTSCRIVVQQTRIECHSHENNLLEECHNNYGERGGSGSVWKDVSSKEKEAV